MKSTRNAASPSASFAGFYWGSPVYGAANRIPVTPGEVISAGVYVMAPYANWMGQIHVWFRDTAGATLAGWQPFTVGSTGAIAANQWFRFVAENITVPAGAAIFMLGMNGNLASGVTVGGEVCYMDDLMVNSGPTLLPYMDGRQSGCGWIGQPDSSMSVQPALRSPAQMNRLMDSSLESGVGNAQVNNNPTLFTMSYDTTVKHSGTQSIKIVRTTATPGAQIGNVSVSGPGTLNNHPNKIWVTPGETISAGGWFRCALDSWRAGFSLSWRDINSVLVGTALTQPSVLYSGANVWVWHTFENIIVPAGVAFFNLNAIASVPSGVTVGGEQAWIDDFICVSGAKCPPVDRSDWRPIMVPKQSNMIRPFGPWTQYDGAVTQSLDLAGQYDGAALQPVDLRDVSIV